MKESEATTLPQTNAAPCSAADYAVGDREEAARPAGGERVPAPIATKTSVMSRNATVIEDIVETATVILSLHPSSFKECR